MAASDVERAKLLLKSAAKAADRLESDVRELVAMRAWEVLGYRDFSDMWEHQLGYKCPTYVQVLAVDAFRRAGMNTRKPPFSGVYQPNGPTQVDVAKAVGLPVFAGKTGENSSTTTNILTQLDTGVDPKNVTKNPKRVDAVIEQHGTRARPKPRRLGKALDEMVQEGFGLRRSEAEEITEIARRAGVPKAEIYRQAVAEYLIRYRASRADSAEVAS